MKRLLILVFLVLAMAAFAQAAPVVITTTMTPTLSWNAVTTLADGTALPAGASVSYDISIRTAPGTGTSVWSGATTTAKITLPQAGVQYDIGVRATRIDTGLQGQYAWASVVGTPNPFYVVGTSNASPPGSTAGISVTP